MNNECLKLRNVQENFLRHWIEVGDNEMQNNGFHNMVDCFYDYYVVFNFLFEMFSQEYADQYCKFAKKEFENEEIERKLHEERRQRRQSSIESNKEKEKDCNLKKECNLNEEKYKLRFFIKSIYEPLFENGFSPKDILIEEPEMLNTPVKRKVVRFYFDDKDEPSFREEERPCSRIHLFDRNDSKMMQEIFDNIYGIRCNLFHGEKVQHCYESKERDRKLISTASKLLKSFLESFMRFQFAS